METSDGVNDGGLVFSFSLLLMMTAFNSRSIQERVRMLSVDTALR
jgi:hypothetical protein